MGPDDIIGIMKKLWFIIFSVSLTVLLAAGGTEYMHKDGNVSGKEACTMDGGMLYDAISGNLPASREFLNDALQGGSSLLCTARQYNVQPIKQSTAKGYDIKVLSRFMPYSHTGHVNGRIALSIMGGIISCNASDYVAAVLQRINI